MNVAKQVVSGAVPCGTGVVLSQLGRRSEPPTIARLMTLALERPDMLSLSAGFTDSGTLPVEAVKAAVGELARPSSGSEWLQYGMNQGRPELRRVLARRLLECEPEAGSVQGIADGMLVGNGSQQTLYLAMQVLCDPGDIVLVDRPSYFVFLEMLTGLGVRARTIPVDDRGRVDEPALEQVLAELAGAGELGRLKAVYFVSYYSNPSSRCMSERDKTCVAEALRRRGCVVPVLEDAAYRLMYFDAPHPARSVLTLPAWEDFPKFYLSTLTKPFSTGLKVGYGYCTDRDWLARMLAVKGHHDFGTSNFAQAVAERVLANGAFDQHLPGIRELYRRKMSVLDEALRGEGLDRLGWRWERPTGGLYLWLAAPGRIDTRMDSPFCKACLDEGVIYVPGDLCFGDAAPNNFVRLSYGVLSEEGLREAARRFVVAARRMA